jgi:hypothetical protein
MNSKKIAYILTFTSFLVACGNDEAKNISSHSDKSSIIGTWASPDKKIVITKENYDDCKWINKAPAENAKITGCVYFYNGTTSKKILLEDSLKYYKDKLAVINKGEKEQISELIKERNDIEKILGNLSDSTLDTIWFDTDGVKSEDCYFFDFFDKNSLYRFTDCTAAGMGRGVVKYTKQ